MNKQDRNVLKKRINAQCVPVEDYSNRHLETISYILRFGFHNRNCCAILCTQLEQTNPVHDANNNFFSFTQKQR